MEKLKKLKFANFMTFLAKVIVLFLADISVGTEYRAKLGLIKAWRKMNNTTFKMFRLYICCIIYRKLPFIPFKIIHVRDNKSILNISTTHSLSSIFTGFDDSQHSISLFHLFRTRLVCVKYLLVVWTKRLSLVFSFH